MEDRSSKLQCGVDTGLVDCIELVTGASKRLESNKEPYFLCCPLGNTINISSPAEVTGDGDGETMHCNKFQLTLDIIITKYCTVE